MLEADRLTSLSPYEWSHEEKHAFLDAELHDLYRYHRENCPEYARLTDALGAPADGKLESLPPLPVRLFKEFSLRSVPQDTLHTTMTSSGTTGQQVSRIYLDREGAALQSRILARITGDFLGQKRLPMIILDTSAVVKDRALFSARGAGILGFSAFGRDRVYALDEQMQLDVEGLKAFLDKHQDEDIFLFGFTFMIWQYFCAQLRKSGYKPDLSRGILIHGGGWKKLADQHISTERFKQELQETCGLTRVHNYYGMVEQTGTVYMECECGHLHAPVWSEITIRRPGDLSEAAFGEKGLIQVSSVLPRSYPGHVLLTEDEGRILGEDDCPCGRKGRYFEILGRIKKAEVRGCSDTYEGPRRAAAAEAKAKTAAAGNGNFTLPEGCEKLCGADLPSAKPLRPFDDRVLAFLNDLSRTLLHDPACRAFPDVITFAYFCRRAGLERMRAAYPDENRLGRGISFHIAPGNVAVNFAYSLAAGLLAGNSCVVKAPSRDFPQIGLICRAIRTLLENEHSALAPYVIAVRYDRSRQDITDALSAVCAARIIWGGNETIARVRQAPLPSRAVEAAFADRYSLLMMGAAHVLSASGEELARAAASFYNDTYLTDQNACTSPRLVYWLGSENEVSSAASRFWKAVHDVAAARYQLEPVVSVDKYTAACRAAINCGGVHLVPAEDRLIMRLRLESLPEGLTDIRAPGGLFAEYAADTPDDLAQVVDPSFQTVVYWGCDPAMIRSAVIEGGLTGIDRIVPIGRSMDFSLVWDGYDLIRTLSRIVALEG